MSIPVVIVDDEEFDRYIAKRVIEVSGADCKIVEFSTGDDFMKVVADDSEFSSQIGAPPPPALVLLDINMPRMNGFEILEELKKQFEAHKHMPDCFIVLMYSSSNYAKDREMSLKYDFVKGYFIKPIDTETFKSLIAEYYPQLSGTEK